MPRAATRRRGRHRRRAPSAPARSPSVSPPRPASSKTIAAAVVDAGEHAAIVTGLVKLARRVAGGCGHGRIDRFRHRRRSPHPDGSTARLAQGLLRQPTSAASPSRAPSRRPVWRPEQVDYVIMGQVLQAGAGQIPARQAAVKAGIPMTVPGADDQQGLPLGHRRDRAGRPADPRGRVRGRRRRRHGVDDPGAALPAEVPRGRQVRRREARRLDVVRRAVGRLHDPGHGRADRGVQRRARHLAARTQDEFSARSHQRAAAAWKNGLFDDEVVPVEIPQRKGDPISFTRRRGHPRRTRPRRASAKLRPAFSKDGTITAGSSSQISDGAAAVVVMSKAKAEELGLDLARRDRRPRRRGRPGLDPAGAARRPRSPRRAPRRASAVGRPRPRRDQRGVRQRRHRLDARPGHRRGQGQRQRRRHRARPPDRHVRGPDRSAPRPRAASAAAAASARPRCAGAAGRATPSILRVPACLSPQPDAAMTPAPDVGALVARRPGGRRRGRSPG